MDINSPRGVSEQLALKGSYSLDQTGRGTLTLQSALGSQHFSLSINPGDIQYVATEGSFTSSSGSAVAGSGSFEDGRIAEYPVAFPSYATDLRGETACNTACLAAGGHADLITRTGVFTPGYADPSGSSIIFDQTVGILSDVGILQTGTYGVPDSNGRSVLTPVAGDKPGTPGRFAIYPLSYLGKLYMISLDPHDRASVVSGTAITAF